MIVLLVTGWTNLLAYSLMSIYGSIGSSSFIDFSGMDHAGVPNTALPRYEYKACYEMPAGTRGNITLVASCCSLLDLRGTNVSTLDA